MYPFGSGRSQPTPPQNQYQSPNPSAPFGAGWTQPSTQPPTHGGYPSPSQQSNNAPYPTGPSYPYPSQPINNAPYPSYGQAAPVAHHPPYPGSSFPHNPQQQYHAPYPPSSTNSPTPYPPPTHSSTPYPPAPVPGPSPSHSGHHHHQGYPPSSSQIPSHNQPPYPMQPSAQPAYPPHAHVTPGGNNTATTGLAKCFGEMNNRQSIVRKEGTPTVHPAQNFDPVKDAHDLRKAMKGFGTDENTLIEIICRRTNDQRQEIQRQYKTHFGKDLVEDIKSETSGNFQKLLVGLLRPIVDFYCHEMCDAMKGIGTDEDVLVEILCTLSNMEIHTIKNQYLRMYGAHLESELKSETSGNFKRLLVSLCTASRDESGHVDPEGAQNDARELLKAGELRVGTDESTFNMILCQRNYHQLRLIFQEYMNMTGHTLEKAIKNEFSGDIQDGLLAIYKCVTNKAEYFASRLYKSMAGLGTNDKQLIRVIITRCEIDMQDIKAAFEGLYGKSLKSWIKGDTSGHYKHALYALIGEQRSS
ncbi:annexin B11 isoform X1 [Episyrphus balteatus]|uniref:annexin B11 isoform X1 n=1 Tax=Episyrphus balteatus TaxID=286459 RepID=UPI00248696C6|nr:annexin B11 isoform X1 [Episyrphus balteatus]